MSVNESLSVQVVKAVAAKEGVSPLELRTPLYDVINPEALETLFRTATGELTFSYHGYTVTVGSDHSITVS